MENNSKPDFRRGPAVWKNKDADQPIDIIGDLAEYDGKYYVQIQGSNMRVPLDEISYRVNEEQLEYLKKESLKRKSNQQATLGSESIKQNTGGSPGLEKENIHFNKEGSKVKYKGNQHLSEEVLEKTAKETVEEMGEEGLEKGMKAFKFGRKAVVGAGAVLIAASALDIAGDQAEKRRARQQQRIQERNQARKDKRSEKYMYAGTGYEPETFDSFVQDMFNQRTGHHKMGNSRF